MPLLIAAILVALLVFHFKSVPSPPEEASAAAAPAASAAPGTPAAETAESPPAAGPPAPSAAAPISDASSRETGDPGVAEEDFTAWMSPLALDTYIRQKNRGHRGGFWTRGNWIRAIEGRWREGDREYRIALGAMERPGEIDWNYRLDLTEAAFAEAFARFAGEGYALAQSQAYRHPDGTLRYQAVWRRGAPAETAED